MTATPNMKAKRIDPNAYNALAEALPLIYWNKQPWARFVREVLRDVPEILAGLDFVGEPKREIAGRIVDRLMSDESRYQAVTISLMLTISRMDSFPNLEAQTDRDEKIARAKAAVAELRKWTERHQAIADEHERYAAEIAKAAEQAARTRAFSASLAQLKVRFLELDRSTDRHTRCAARRSRAARSARAAYSSTAHASHSAIANRSTPVRLVSGSATNCAHSALVGSW